MEIFTDGNGDKKQERKLLVYKETVSVILCEKAQRTEQTHEEKAEGTVPAYVAGNAGRAQIPL